MFGKSTFTLNVSGLLLMFLAMLAGSRAVASSLATNLVANTNGSVLDGRWHTVQITPPAKLPKIFTLNKFNPVWWFGNADEPVPPRWFRPDDKHRIFKWRMRNPFHNFTFYVIGIADKPHLRSGRYPNHVGNPNYGWNFAVAKRKWVRLPFVSYKRGRFEFYLGWRTRGNFGGKINIRGADSPKVQPPAVHSTTPSASSALPAAGP
ncbi:MAG TPA: hypothetical protein VK327_07035 [Candidatus Paceibacterota bacterium]|nr:hypothetical protein [Candidatus Paceibacterota bacterium]